jgi:FkbM family methyltransferase
MGESPAGIVPSPGDEAIIARNEFGLYSIPAAAAYRPAASTTIIGAVWEKETLTLIRKYVGTRDIVHAGAFFGDFLPPLSAALQDGARIWAFEPSPLSFRHAERTIALNAIDNVELRMVGLGDISAMRPLAFNGPPGSGLAGGSIFRKNGLPPAQRQTLDAEIVRIDDVIPADRDVGVIQLDLEGYEFKALRGAVGTIRRCRPLLIIEANRPLPRCVRLLSELKYRIVGMVNANLVLRPAEIEIELEAATVATTAAGEPTPPAAAAAPIIVAAPATGSGPAPIEIAVGGAVVRVSPGADVDLLADVLRLLRSTAL